MCGICGVAGEGDVDPALLESAAATMAHRGPDDQGIWISNKREAGLAHRRLSVIDLSDAGHQPMLHDSDLAISFNGEIYNFPDLRRELEQSGHRFASGTDTEVVLAGYREWGTEVVNRLNGMFALAIYDERDRRLFLARDRAGEKPLFYRHEGRQFQFASELKALLIQGSLPPKIDPAALNQYLAFGYVMGDACIISGIRKLPQASALVYDVPTNQIRVWRYWTLPDPTSVVPAKATDLIEQLDELLADSVRMRLIADVPVGIMLSGGLDSSLITAMAARVSDVPVHTYNISFPGEGTFDESKHARLVASHFGTRHTEFAAEHGSVDLLPLLAAQYDEPLADSSIIPTYIISKLIRSEATVALGGDGGDELFGGYYHHDWGRRMQLVQNAVPRPLRRGVSLLAKALPARARGRDYLRAIDQDVDVGMARLNRFFDVSARQALLAPSGIPVDEAPELLKASLAFGSTPGQRSTAMDFRSYLVDDILVKVDRASMLASLEVRAPFLDHRLIEFAFSKVPDVYRSGGGRKKVLPKLLAQRILPRELELERKQGFSVPMHSWFRASWGEYMESVLEEVDPALFDRAVIRRLIHDARSGKPTTHLIFSLTMFELWRRHYGVSM